MHLAYYVFPSNLQRNCIVTVPDQLWEKQIEDDGVATFVQATVVQGDLGPRGQMSKGTNVQGTVVQGYFGPRRLLSKKAFTCDKLAQIIFFILHWILQY